MSRVHEQQLSLRHVGIEELISRRRQLKSSLQDKRSRLQAARKAVPERSITLSREIWDKREAVILETHRFIQALSREVEAEEEEVARLNRRIRARQLPRGVAGAIEKKLDKAERRKK